MWKKWIMAREEENLRSADIFYFDIYPLVVMYIALGFKSERSISSLLFLWSNIEHMEDSQQMYETINR